jgi:hypothetical protein
MRIVHGYVCRNCADEALAKRDVDPARPRKAEVTGPLTSPDAARQRVSNPDSQQNRTNLAGDRLPTSLGGGRKLDFFG